MLSIDSDFSSVLWKNRLLCNFIFYFYLKKAIRDQARCTQYPFFGISLLIQHDRYISNTEVNVVIVICQLRTKTSIMTNNAVPVLSITFVKSILNIICGVPMIEISGKYLLWVFNHPLLHRFVHILALIDYTCTLFGLNFKLFKKEQIIVDDKANSLSWMLTWPSTLER